MAKITFMVKIYFIVKRFNRKNICIQQKLLSHGNLLYGQFILYLIKCRNFHFYRRNILYRVFSKFPTQIRSNHTWLTTIRRSQFRVWCSNEKRVAYLCMCGLYTVNNLNSNFPQFSYIVLLKRFGRREQIKLEYFLLILLSKWQIRVYLTYL